MFKKIGIPLVTTSLVVGVLAGCGANKEEFAPGIQLYNEGSFESLVKSKEFFTNYIQTNGESKDATKWVKEINKQLLKLAEPLTEEAYAAKDFESAMQYVEVGLAIDPSSEKFKGAHSLVSTALNQQNIFDDYADFLEETYVFIKHRLNNWETALNSAKNGSTSLPTLKYNISVLHSDMRNLREIVNNKTFEFTSNDTSYFKNRNLYLFDYVLEIEKELSKLSTGTEDFTIKSIEKTLSSFTVTGFTDTFSELADKMLAYTTEKNRDGKPIRNIKNTLDFTKAFKEFQEGTNPSEKESAE